MCALVQRERALEGVYVTVKHKRNGREHEKQNKSFKKKTKTEVQHTFTIINTTKPKGDSKAEREREKKHAGVVVDCSGLHFSNLLTKLKKKGR